MASKLFQRLLSRVPEETDNDVRLSMEIALRISELMRSNNMSQSDLARKMEKDPAEISRWLSGMHTFTTKTLGKLHAVFGEPIILVTQSEVAKIQENAKEVYIKIITESDSFLIPNVIANAQFDTDEIERESDTITLVNTDIIAIE